MSEHFSDDNFIQAAKVYQSMKAPSDLRERILADAAAYTAQTVRPETVSATDTERTEISVRRKRSHGKIYKFASLAACLAIMVASLPNWLPSEDVGEAVDGTGPAVQPRVIAEVPDDVPQTVSNEEHQPDMAAFTLEPGKDSEGSGEAAAEQQTTRNGADAAAETGNGASAVSDGNVRTEDFEKKTESGEPEEVQQEEIPAKTSSVAVSKLIPGMAANAVLENLEVRLVQGEDGTCTVELTNGEKMASVSVAKNAESGQWEVMETEPN